MAIKNYTTKIDDLKTIGEIEKILSKFGAKSIMKNFDGAGHCIAVSFMVDVGEQQIPFKLPIDLNAWITLVNQAVKEGKLTKRYMNDADQARRVGWRVIKDWIDAQLALVSTQTVKIEQVFLPYAIINIEGQTLFEMIENRGFGNLQLTGSEENE